MKQTFLLLIIIIFSFNSNYAQKSVDDIFSSLPGGENMICNKKGKLAHYIVKQGNSVIEYAEYYGSGNLKSYGTYKNGKKHGVFVKFSRKGEFSYFEKYDSQGLTEYIQFSIYKDTTKLLVYWKRESPYNDSITEMEIDLCDTYRYLCYNIYYNKLDGILSEGFTYNRNKTGQWIYNMEKQGGIDSIIQHDNQSYSKPIIPESYNNMIPEKYIALSDCDCEDYKSTRKKTFEAGFGMCFGYSFMADYQENYLPSSPSGGFTAELSYSNFFLFGRFYALGVGDIKSDYNDSEFFKVGNSIYNDFREASIGYCVLDNTVDRLIPFVGYSMIKTKIEDKEEKTHTISQNVPVFGIVWDRKKILPKAEDKIGIKKENRTLMKVTLTVSPYEYDSGPSGILVNMNLGFSLNNQYFK